MELLHDSHGRTTIKILVTNWITYTGLLPIFNDSWYFCDGKCLEVRNKRRLIIGFLELGSKFGNVYSVQNFKFAKLNCREIVTNC